MKIHKAELYKDRINYYFTKSRNECLLVEYDATDDYIRNGRNTSGARFRITIHNYNSWVKKDLTQITIDQVPNSVIEALTYLKTTI